MIAMRQITKFYGAHAALAGLDLEVARGQVVGLLGLNGAGKTTCLRLLSGQISPTSGRIEIGGRDLEGDGPRGRAGLGFLPQQPPVYPEMTVAGYLRFALDLRVGAGTVAGAPAARRAAVDRAMQACDLAALADQPIGVLSDGTRRRVGIAQAVVHRPEVVLLDEPTAGLDPRQIVHVRRLVKQLGGAHTVLVSSHMLEEIRLVCDTLYVLHEGRVVAHGSEAALAERTGGAHDLVVVVRGAEGAAAAALSGLEGLAALETRPQAGGDAGAAWTLHIACTADIREAVAARLVGAGLGLCHLERRGRGLEEIFMALTGRARP